MTLDKALELSDEWTRGHTFYKGAGGWRVVIAVLAAEVRQLRIKRDTASDDVARRAAEVASSQDAIGKTPAQVAAAILREFGLSD